MFALGWWIFIDGAVYYSTYKNEANKAIEVEDVLPGIFSTFALIIVNLINKESLNASDYEFGSSNVATKARGSYNLYRYVFFKPLFLGCAFFGVTMSITSIIGGVILCIFKLNEKEYSYAPSYLGISIALQNILIFIGSMFLWFGRNSTESSGF